VIVHRATIEITFTAALLFLCVQIIPADNLRAETLLEAMDAIEKSRKEIAKLETSDDPARYDMISDLKDSLSSYAGKEYEIARSVISEQYDLANHIFSLKPGDWGEKTIRFEATMYPREALGFKRSFSGKLLFSVKLNEKLIPYVTEISDESGRIRFDAIVKSRNSRKSLTVLSAVKSDRGKYIVLGPEGKRAIILVNSGEVNLHSTITGEKIWQSNVYTTPSGAAISDDGNILIVSTISGSLYVLSLRDGTKTGRLRFPGMIRTISLSPDGRRASVGLISGDVYIVDIGTKKKEFRITHNGPVTSVAFSPDNRFAFSGGGDSRVKIIYLPVMKMIWELHLKGVPETLMISPSGDTISALISFFYLGVWKMDLWTKEVAWRFNSFVTSYDISQDGGLIACAFAENKVGLYDIHSGKTFALFPQEHNAKIVKFLPDSTIIAVADIMGNLSFIDYEEKKLVISLRLDAPATVMATNSSGEYLSILCGDDMTYTYYLKSLSGVYPMFKVGSTFVLMKIPSG
jgi:WD40 repeat protein